MRATGFRFGGGGTGLAGTLTSASGSGYPGVKKGSCMELRIAPSQPFPPYAALWRSRSCTVPTPTHGQRRPRARAPQPRGRRADRLPEHGTGRQDPALQRPDQGVGRLKKQADLALDLEAGGRQVPIDVVVSTGKTATLTVTTLVEGCKQLAERG